MGDLLDSIEEDVCKAGKYQGGLCLNGLKAVITMDSSNPIVWDAYIYIEEGLIKDIGVGKGPSAEVKLEVKNKIAIPGMIDLHSHSSQVFLRGAFDEMCLMEWLNATETLYKRIGRELLEISSIISFLERIKGGITTVVDMEPYPEIIAKASDKVGLRAEISVLLADIPELPDQEVSSLEEEINKAKRTVEEFKKNKKIWVSLAPVGFPAVSNDLFKASAELAREKDLRLHTHVGESRINANLCRRRNGRSEIELLEDLGFLGPKTQLAHVIWVSDNDIETLSKYRTAVVHCPSSNLKLASGVTKVPEMMKMGVRVGLGLDGAASNSIQDMFQEMRIASTLHKGVRTDPKAVSAKDALEMATSQAANILGLEKKVGRISPGYWADITLIDISKPRYLPLENIKSHIVYSAQSSDVFGVIVDGEVLIWNGAHVNLDENSILKKSEELFSEFLHGVYP